MIKEYLEYQKSVKNLSDATIEGYGKDLRIFVEWARQRSLTWRTIVETDIDAWLTSMQEAGLKPATRNRRLSSVRNLLAWAHHKGMLNTNAARFCQSAKLNETLPKTIDIENIDKYLSSGKMSTKRIISGLLIAIMLETGMRIGEALAIKQEDIDTRNRSIKVFGKGAKERIVYYGQRTEKELRIWLDGREGRLFPETFTQYDYRMMIEEELYPFSGKMTPHQLRHTFATAMLNRGLPITTLSHLMGHKYVETTQRYARVATTTAAQQYKQFKF